MKLRNRKTRDERSSQVESQGQVYFRMDEGPVGQGKESPGILGMSGSTKEEPMMERRPPTYPSLLESPCLVLVSANSERLG